MNLLKSLNNPDVQGIVAVTDAAQIEIIRSHSGGVSPLTGKLKFWDYQKVLEVHEALESDNEANQQIRFGARRILEVIELRYPNFFTMEGQNADRRALTSLPTLNLIA